MAPIHIDIEALSGVMGSVSIACWVVVFSPQIIENFRRSSAEGLSVTFIFIWLIGDIFNILGAVLQGVLPTMIILAAYYTLADIVLLLQCFYYRGFTLKDRIDEPSTSSDTANPELANERTSLLNTTSHASNGTAISSPTTPNGAPRRDSSHFVSFPDYTRRPSSSTNSFRQRLNSEPHHLSPANPIHQKGRDTDALKAQSPIQRRNVLKSVLVNLTIIVLVCAAGVLGWYLSTIHNHKDSDSNTPSPSGADIPTFNILGQVFGYICTVLYLCSRLPQLILNYRRKSTEGISMLFFLFACLGNLTYVFSIFAYDPPCPDGSSNSSDNRLVIPLSSCSSSERRSVYGWYVLVNLSWLLGSAGTLFLDGFVFVQYFLYRNKEGEDESAIVN